MARSVARMNRFEDRMHNYRILVPFQLMDPEYANLSFLVGRCNSLAQAIPSLQFKSSKYSFLSKSFLFFFYIHIEPPKQYRSMKQFNERDFIVSFTIVAETLGVLFFFSLISYLQIRFSPDDGEEKWI